MQPVDALTIRAVIQEAKSLLVNRKVDRVHQLARDEIILSLRSRVGMSNLLLSAHASLGRLCLVNLPVVTKRPNPPAFCLLLRKHLTGGTIAGVEQLLGERIVDIVFSCVDEVGQTSLKVLSAEIMGRHSNLIFWNKENDHILGASHVVTKEMSRQREVVPGLRYVRPPSQERPNIFKLTRDQFGAQASRLAETHIAQETLEDWLLTSFAGLGRHLAEEIVEATLREERGEDVSQHQWIESRLWMRLETLQRGSDYQPAMRLDLSGFTVLSWNPAVQNSQQWKTFPAVNDMLEEYFRGQELKERFQQLRDRINTELQSESARLESRLAAASKQLGTVRDVSEYKKFGDLVLAHLNEIAAGQNELVCDDLYSTDGTSVAITLNPNLSAAQNAQQYYRQFAKSRVRASAAGAAQAEASKRLAVIRGQLEQVGATNTIEDLEVLRDSILVRRAPEPARPPSPPVPKKKAKSRLLSITSSDGWTIFVGRNRHENDELISRLAQPRDIWLHVQGQGGAHVLIKVPSGRQDAPATTLTEAAQAAARLSKALAGGKVRVMYTQCRYVRKVPGGKPGVVTYENERTIEVDTSGPMPPAVKQLFVERHGRP